MCRLFLTCCLAFLATAPALEIPAGIDHAPWTELLGEFVDDQGLVAYDTWRQDPAARDRLDAYLAGFAAPARELALGADRHAGMINAYNALTVREVLRRDPAGSFWDLEPFEEPRHVLGGEQVSLDAIEHQALRPELGYRVHAALVCAARSCPPLPRQAFTAAMLDKQLDARMAVWLADPRLNRYDRAGGTVHLSRIVDWFAADFAAAGGIPAVLARHGPPDLREWLASGGYAIHHLPYDRSLNAR